MRTSLGRVRRKSGRMMLCTSQKSVSILFLYSDCVLRDGADFFCRSTEHRL